MQTSVHARLGFAGVSTSNARWLRGGSVRCAGGRLAERWKRRRRGGWKRHRPFTV